GVEVDALRVADRSEREPVPGDGDGGMMFASLREQMVHQAARTHIALVAGERVMSTEIAGDAVSDLTSLERALRMPRTAGRPVQSPFQGRGSYRCGRGCPGAPSTGQPRGHRLGARECAAPQGRRRTPAR